MEKNTVSADIAASINVVSNPSFEYEIVEKRIFQLNGELAKEQDNRKTMKMFSIFLIVVSVIISYIERDSYALYACIFFVVFSVLLFTVSSSDAKEKNLERTIQEEEKKLNRLEKSQDKPAHSNASRTEYFDSLVRININNLEAYYSLVKNSNSKSFLVSIIIATIGIIFISTGIILGFIYKDEYKDIAYISSAAGTFIELVTGMLFYLYNKTVIQLKEYHSSLLDVQNILLSFKLIGDVDDEKVKTDLMKDMLSFLVKNK